MLNQRTGESFVYDDNGNPTTYKGTSGFTYDPNNHLTTYPNELTMGYHQGLRAWKDDGTDRTYFLYSGVTPVCEMDEDGDVIAVNTFGANGLVARTEGETTTYYTFDEGGNVAQTLEEDGDVASTELYDAYGNPLYGSSYPYGYGGQQGYYTDEETGLVLATYRYYDPTEGRWLTRDPIGYAGGLNFYGYCSGNPVNYIDLMGLCPWGGGQSSLIGMPPSNPNPLIPEPPPLPSFIPPSVTLRPEPSWGGTFQFGVQGSGGLGGGGQVSGGLIFGWGSKGFQFGLFGSIGAGGYGGYGGSAGLMASYSGNNDIYVLSGKAGTVGVSGGEYYCGGADVNFIEGKHPAYDINAGYGAGLPPFEQHCFISTTGIVKIYGK